MLKYLLAIGTWLGPPLVAFALPTDAPGLTCLAMIYLYLGGLCLAFVFFIRFFATREKPPAVAASFLALLLWVLVWQYGFTFGARVHLMVNQSRYEQIIAKLNLATSIEEKNRICGGKCIAYPHHPIVAFHYCHCFYNWPDIVYDPTGALSGDGDEVRKLDFYLHGSKRLSKFWYIGYFGD